MKREDEEFCRMQFSAFLSKFFSPPEVSWTEVAQQDEPPDYYLCLKDIHFAVEVTTLLEKIPVGSSSLLPPSVISKFVRDFVEKVEIVARAKGCLRGCYLVVFPTPIESLSDVQDEIQRTLLDYFRRTYSLDTSPPEIVFERIAPQRIFQRCEVLKLHNKHDRILPGGPFWTKWEGNAAIILCDLLRESINTKVSKLANIAVPRILLLLDEYMFADRETYEKCIPHISLLSSFHTVFVVKNDGGGFVIHSQNSHWSKPHLL
jgi:hypothetical protein